MTEDKVFVEYYGTQQTQALPQSRIQPWEAMEPPTAPTGMLKDAVELAQQAVHTDAAV